MSGTTRGFAWGRRAAACGIAAWLGANAAEAAAAPPVFLRTTTLEPDAARIGAKVVFPSTAAGFELHATDGTAAGTVLVKSFAGASTPPRDLIPMGTYALFRASIGANPEALWRTDGTSAGTTVVSSFVPSFARAVAGGRAYYVTTSGSQVCTSDGTDLGTYCGGVLSGIGLPVPADQGIFFSATDAPTGTELRRFSLAGTSIVQDMSPGAASTTPIIVGALASDVVFHAMGQLWRTTGGGTGVQNLSATITGVFEGEAALLSLAAGSRPRGTLPGGSLMFACAEGAVGLEVCRTDGTVAGTTRIADINAGAPSSTPSNFVAYKGAVYFRAEDATHGAELWRTDGTAAGTTLVADIQAGAGSGAPSFITVVGDYLVFVANDGAHGWEPWASDGSHTWMLADLNLGPADSNPGSFSRAMTGLGNTLVFHGASGTETGVFSLAIEPPLVDGGAPDAAADGGAQQPSPPDGGIVDAGSGTRDPALGPSESSASGCGCTLVSTRAHDLALPGGLLGFVLLVLRRRSRRGVDLSRGRRPPPRASRARGTASSRC